MNHTQLKAFHAVAQCGSYTGASRLLHVTQPTLSIQVKALEFTYGAKLFERQGRGVALTELGLGLLDITRRLYALESDAEQYLLAAHNLTTGRLRVGADAPYHIVPLVAAFNRRHPGIQLSFSFGNSIGVLQDLLERRIEIAVLAELASEPRIFSIPLLRDRLICFVARHHPWSRRRSVNLTELVSEQLVLRERGSTTRAVFEKGLESQGIRLGEVLEIGSREAVREAVAAGLGVGVVAQSELGSDPRLHALSIRGATLEAIEYAACLAEQRRIQVVNAFFDLVTETYTDI